MKKVTVKYVTCKYKQMTTIWHHDDLTVNTKKNYDFLSFLNKTIAHVILSSGLKPTHKLAKLCNF